MRILFHHPLPLNQNATSASGIRPIRMLNAFKSLGYEVDLIVGYGKDRKVAIRRVKQNIQKGVRYKFLYSESSTMPMTLTEKNHLPLYPFLDWFFFRLCNKHNIPIGLFYRDIYWAFDEYKNDLSLLKVTFAKVAYKFDLWVYEKTLSKLYLPSMKMGDYLSTVNSSKFDVLPPGHTKKEINGGALYNNKQEFNFFYVGGLGAHYKMHKWFQVVSKLPFINFTLCTREAEWNAVKHEYSVFMAQNIQIIHKSGDDLKPFYLEADIFMLFMQPHAYRDFAVPLKLFEYIGEKKPILASAGTMAGDFIEKYELGWTVNYDVDAIKNFLTSLFDCQVDMNRIQKNLNQISSEHTWLKRAEKVVSDLN